MYVVVLAGGGGTRLRPLSRPDRPKPFLPLLGPETLFQRTVSRVRDLAPGPIHVVVEPAYVDLVRSQAHDVDVIVEPAARNTAAAIALASGAIDRADDEVMVVLPADHVIEDERLFREVLRNAESELAREFLGIERPLVTLGVEVTRAATEYGYLIPDLERQRWQQLHGYVLRAFEEKPNEARARELCAQEGVAWNAGMFLWQRGAIRQALRDYSPRAAAIADATSDDERRRAYASVEPLSIDRAVMERAAADGRVVMGSMDVGWTDLGGWTALLAALPEPSGATGRVLEAGESAVLRPDDLLVAPANGRLDVLTGPRDTITAAAPSALLSGARAQERHIRKLIERVAAEDNQ